MILTALIYLLILLLPLGQLGRIPLGPGVNVYLHDLLVLVIICFGTVKLIIAKRRLMPFLFGPIVVFTAMAIMSLLLAINRYSPQEIFTGSLYLWRWLAYAGIYFLLVQSHIFPLLKSKLVYQLLILTGFITAVFGLLQYILLPDTRFLFVTNWDEHYYRLIGPLLDPAFTGLILVLALLLALDFYWQNLFGPKKLLTSYFLLLTSFLALLLTYSRSSYLAFVVGLIIWGFFRHLRAVLIILFFFICGTALLPRPGGEGVKLERTQSIVARVTASQQILTIIASRPLTGIGFNLLRYEQRNRGFLDSNWQQNHAASGADNSFLFILVTSGIMGLAAYMWLVVCQIYFALKFKRVIYLTVFLAVLVHSQFNHSLFYPAVMLWLWILIGTEEKETRESKLP